MRARAFILLAALASAPASAGEPERSTGWRLRVCEPDKPCALRGKVLAEATACALDLASLVSVLPSATKISCVRVEVGQVVLR